MPRLCEVYPGIFLTTEEKAQKNLKQGSRRMPVGTMKTEYTEQSIRNNKNAIENHEYFFSRVKLVACNGENSRDEHTKV